MSGQQFEARPTDKNAPTNVGALDDRNAARVADLVAKNVEAKLQEHLSSDGGKRIFEQAKQGGLDAATVADKIMQGMSGEMGGRGLENHLQMKDRVEARLRGVWNEKHSEHKAKGASPKTGAEAQANPEALAEGLASATPHAAATPGLKTSANPNAKQNASLTAASYGHGLPQENLATTVPVSHGQAVQRPTAGLSTPKIAPATLQEHKPDQGLNVEDIKNQLTQLGASIGKEARRAAQHELHMSPEQIERYLKGEQPWSRTTSTAAQPLAHSEQKLLQGPSYDGGAGSYLAEVYGTGGSIWSTTGGSRLRAA